MKKLVTALIALALLIGVHDANAARPVRSHIGPFFVNGQFLGDCGGFNVLSDYWIEGNITVYFDKDGNPIREFDRYDVQGQSRYYNSANPSIFVAGGNGEHELDRVNFVDDTWTVLAVAWRVTLPGQGHIYLQTGRFIFDIADVVAGDFSHPLFAAGPTDFFQGNVEQLCAALAGS